MGCDLVHVNVIAWHEDEEKEIETRRMEIGKGLGTKGNYPLNPPTT